MSQGPVTAGIGWLDGSAKTPMPEEVRRVVGSRFGEEFDVVPSGFYQRAVGYRGGAARVEWDGRADAASTTRVEVKQGALDELGLVGSVELMRELTDAGVTLSRTDQWVNDRDRRMTPARVRAAVLGGQAVTHARPGRYFRDDLDGRETYYLGRPSSDRLVRCYDRPDTQCRMELQARRRYAAHAGSLVMAAESPAVAVVSNVISFVDFRESKARDRSGRRRPRLDWWAAVVEDSARAEAAPSRPRPSLEELAGYFREHWARALAELVGEFGSGWLEDVLSDGFDRLREQREVEVVA